MGVSATLLALSTVLTSVDMANAATFNFSFSNEDGAVNGTVSGTIELPDGDFVNQPATSLIITSAPPALGYTVPVDVLANPTFVSSNIFTVVGGAIDNAVSRFAAFFSSSSFGLRSPGIAFFGTGLSLQSSINSSSGVQDDDSSTLVYSPASNTPVSTPEPTSVITLIGVGVLGVASKLKKKA